jgi:hypothetical protein
MAALGLVVHARSTAELGAALTTALRAPSVAFDRTTEAATLALAATPRVVVRLRDRLAHGTATTLALAAVLFALLASDATYPLVAEALALPESTTLATPRNAVALVVRGSRGDLLAFAPIAHRERLRASVATSDPLTSHDVAALRRAGLDPLPELPAGGVGSWLAARRELERQIETERVTGRFAYLAPREGYTITDYLLLRELGGMPIQAGRELVEPGDDAEPLRRGTVVTATLGGASGQSRAALLEAVRRLAEDGLGVASVQELAAGRRSP